MAGETIKTPAICLRISPWSKTSHIVTWLTPSGKVTTLVKGAVRPKSAFLGQYDLNYECEIVYYAKERGEMHAIRECSIIDMRENLRGEWRLLAMAAGLKPDLDGEKGAFSLRGERSLAVSQEVLHCIRNPGAEKNIKILLDTTGVIGVFYLFHVDSAADCRRSVLKMIS